MPERTKRLHAGLVAAVVLAASSCIGHHTAAPLERIEQIMALPFPVAYHRVPVDLKGWVTLSDPTTNLVCLEDGTGAARVILPFLNIDLRMGNTLEIIGEVNEGGPTPTIVASEAMLLEGTHEPLAPPRPGRRPHCRPHRLSLRSGERRSSLLASGPLGSRHHPIGFWRNGF
jgi:hypothetical protein